MAEKTSEKAPGTFSLLGTASTMGLHMVSGPIVGGGLGWLIDQGLDSWPIASAIGLVLGLAAGFRNVWADARYLEKSNAAIDAERRKREEEAEKALKSGSNTEKSALSRTIVPPVHKAQEVPAESAHAAVSPCASDTELAGDDMLTASVLAGTAAPEERELEELDETMEAIRRVLAGEDDVKTSEQGSGSTEKGAV